MRRPWMRPIDPALDAQASNRHAHRFETLIRIQNLIAEAEQRLTADSGCTPNSTEAARLLLRGSRPETAEKYRPPVAIVQVIPAEQ